MSNKETDLTIAMTKNDTNGKQLNNKGFSLVEVLIAMIILGIAIGPILYSFVTGIKINAKAKEQQRLNSAAQSIMEGFKAYSIDQLEEQFDGSKDFKIYNSEDVIDGTGTAVSSVSGYACDIRTYTPASNPHGYISREKEGEFYLKGMNYQGQVFDARVSIVPYSSVSSSYDGSDVIEYIENMNGYQDCVYRQQPDEISKNYFSLLTIVAAKLNEIDKIYGYVGDDDPTLGYRPANLNMSYVKIYRNTKVTIDDSVVQIKTVYTAKVDGYPYYNDLGIRQYLTSDFELVKDEEYYNNSATMAELNNVFLFVYPAYKDSGYPVQEDEYEINYVGLNHLATGSHPMEVFFVKQQDASIANLLLCENSYSPSFSITNVSFYHNLSDNLADGSTTGAPYFSTIGTADIIPGISYKVFQTLVYEVKVELYEEGTVDLATKTVSGTPIYTLTGTKNDN